MDSQIDIENIHLPGKDLLANPLLRDCCGTNLLRRQRQSQARNAIGSDY
jgi:hypothetical protein